MFSKIVRRTHMYLALFLTPWVLMYALSTMVMNHREYFREFHGDGPPAFEEERVGTYSGTFAPDAEPRVMALQILAGLEMEGAHNARMSKDGSTLTIQRFEPIRTRRLTFTVETGQVVIEKELFRTSTFLERMHRRRGFQSDYPLEDSWGLSVDLVICSMLFWVASGIWLWWEMKATRRWGALFGAGGLALFGLFLLTI